jgi:hypothetical protein
MHAGILAFLLLVMGQRGAPPNQTPKSSSPIDLTGYWTSVINEDWRLRMLTPKKDDFGMVFQQPPGVESLPSIPYKPNGIQIARQFDPSKDEATGNQCNAYGAAGVMRQPTHLHITWQDDNTLKLETDFGSQTRLFHFAPPQRGGRMNFFNGDYFPPEITKVDPPPGTEPSLQGYSIASWNAVGGRGGIERGGSLKVVTSKVKPGYYWKNGMPYSANAVVTEYFRTMELPDSSEWILFTQIVEDPEYLTQPFIVNYQFKKLPDESKWSPTPCSVK